MDDEPIFNNSDPDLQSSAAHVEQVTVIVFVLNYWVFSRVGPDTFLAGYRIFDRIAGYPALKIGYL